MDWKAIDFDWNRTRAFLVTAEEGSLTAAARALRTNQSTLSRQVAALEQELGVPLFEKVGRKLELTPNGLALLEFAKDMAASASKLSLTASGKSDSLVGNVCISASEANACYILPPIVIKLRQQQPGISIEIVASNETSDLRKREADIAIRNFQPNHVELIARRLPSAKAGLYASPEYLRSLPDEINKNTLQHAAFIGFPDNAPYIKGLQEIGLPLNADNFPYITNSHLAHWELVKQGAGIGVMLESIAAQTPEVERVSDELPDFEVDTWLVSHRELRTNARIRLVYDFLAEELSAPQI